MGLRPFYGLSLALYSLLPSSTFTHLRWLKRVSPLERNVLIRKIDTTTLYHLTAMLWYHIKHQLLLRKIQSFL